MIDESRLDELEKRVSKLEVTIFSNADNPVIRRDDLRSFVESLKPKMHEERALYIAYYFEQSGGKNNFSMKDIEDGYEKCKVKKYSNMRMLAKRLHEERGWIMPAGQKDDITLWTLTADGENQVKKTLEKVKNFGDGGR